MPTVNELKRLERTLGEQLGLNPYGEPLYKWQRAGDMVMPCIQMDGFGGIKYEFKDVPVLDEQGQPIIDEFKSLAYDDDSAYYETTRRPRVLAKPFAVVKQYRMADWLNDDQWVMTRWFRTPKEAWDEMCHGLLPWPSRGYYYAGNAALDLGEFPNAGNTDETIQLIHKQRRLTFDDWIRITEAGMDRAERACDSRIDDIMRDTFTAYGSANPGARGGHYSFGGTEISSPKEETPIL